MATKVAPKKAAAKPAPAKKPAAKVAAKPAPAKKPAPKAPAQPAPAKKPAPAKVDLKTKAGLIATIADAAGISKAQAEKGYAAFIALAYKNAKAKEGYVVPGLCKIAIKERKARTGHNPRTGAAIKIPKAKILKVKALKVASDAVLGKK